MIEGLTFAVVQASALGSNERAEIINLCTDAYEEDFAHLFVSLPGSTHLLGRLDGKIVTHAAWVTRWLEPQGQPLLRTAYIEAVATLPLYQRRGFGSSIMRELKNYILDYDLGALSPSEVGFYERLGWELWQGPLAIRKSNALELTPDEEVMILRLPRTSELNLSVLLTAEWRAGELW